jgi:hypothetical protein
LGWLDHSANISGADLWRQGSDALARWYADHLGRDPPPATYEQRVWWQQQGPTVFAPFPADTNHFGRPEQAWKLNLRVRNLDAMVAQLRAACSQPSTPTPTGWSASSTPPTY